MALIGLALDDSENDIFVTKGKVALVLDDALIARNLRTRLLTRKGEWILDTSYGYDYATILGERVIDLKTFETTLKQYILDTEGVTTISTFRFDFDAGNERKLRLTLGVNSIFNTVITLEGLPLG